MPMRSSCPEAARWFQRGFLSLTSPAAAVAACSAALVVADGPLAAAGLPEGFPVSFADHVEPILAEYCYDCHADGVNKGNLSLDEYDSVEAMLGDRSTWKAVWDNLRSQLMPPARKDQPTPEEVALVTGWIQHEVFGLDCEAPDPGRVTIRRLNRTEYRNTIRDLVGVDFDTSEEFPADDSGYGFDNIGDVLTISPLLMEKYLAAAEEIVGRAVYLDGPRIPTLELWANQFRGEDDRDAEHLALGEARSATREIEIRHPGPYRLRLDSRVEGSGEFSGQTAVVVLEVDGEEAASREIGWDHRETLELTVERELAAGQRRITLSIRPGAAPAEGQNPLELRVRKLDLHGPLDGSHTVYPDEYAKVFVDGPPPEDDAEREAYARRLLAEFAKRAFRRPADAETVDRLVAMAISTGKLPGRRFEHGIAQAMTAILASPRFLFRAETQADPDDPGRIVPLDGFALASRLSYFLWSSMPDEELFRLAGEGTLRDQLREQVGRMLEDRRSDAFVRHFVGQWLQTRDVESIPVNAGRILRRRDADSIFDWRVRRAMRQETEMLFEHIVREDRPLTDLLVPDYTFLNGPLARFYGIDGVEGDRMQKVSLPADSVRGGILGQGSVLLVTSNPTRTSPVKRGLFILDNVLGTPAPPAPPNVPELEEARREVEGDRRPTMRELMEIHREKPLCASCHERMDPIGLALENFNALGMWRDDENGEPIESAGRLITGESFDSLPELKGILANERRRDFYRCVTERLMTYALGRGLEYFDSCAVDAIVDRLEAGEGRMSDVIFGVVESTPFLFRRGDGDPLDRGDPSTAVH